MWVSIAFKFSDIYPHGATVAAASVDHGRIGAAVPIIARFAIFLGLSCATDYAFSFI